MNRTKKMFLKRLSLGIEATLRLMFRKINILLFFTVIAAAILFTQIFLFLAERNSWHNEEEYSLFREACGHCHGSDMVKATAQSADG